MVIGPAAGHYMPANLRISVVDNTKTSNGWCTTLCSYWVAESAGWLASKIKVQLLSRLAVQVMLAARYLPHQKPLFKKAKVNSSSHLCTDRHGDLSIHKE
jgi:hypothetical protein